MGASTSGQGPAADGAPRAGLGNLIAFQEYLPFVPPGRSAWVGLDNFAVISNGAAEFLNAPKNTLLITLVQVILVFPTPIALALLKVATAVTDEKKSRWAFALPPTAALSAMLGFPNCWEVREGRLPHSRQLDEHKQMIAISRQLVTDGLMHPDGVAKDNQKVWSSQGSAVTTARHLLLYRGLLPAQCREELRHWTAGVA